MLIAETCGIMIRHYDLTQTHVHDGHVRCSFDLLECSATVESACTHVCCSISFPEPQILS